MIQESSIPIGKRTAESQAAVDREPVRAEADKAASRFGELLRAERLRRNLSMDALAHLSGLTVGNVWQIEDGRVKPRWCAALALSMALGCSVSYLAGETEARAVA